MFGYAVRPCGIEQLFVLFQAAGTASWRMVSRNGCRATQILPIPNNCYPDPDADENQALGNGPSFGVKRTMVRFREAAEGLQA